MPASPSQLTVNFVLACNDAEASENPDHFREAIHALLYGCKALQEDPVQAVLSALPQITVPRSAGMTAVWLGAAVEGGKDPKVSYASVRQILERLMSDIIPATEDCAMRAADDVLEAVQRVAMSMVAHLSASEALYQEFRQDTGLIRKLEQIEHGSAGAMWLMQMARQCSGELVVLNVVQEEGALVRYANLSNCFHLFTLLQGALSRWLPLKERPSATLIDQARGRELEMDDGQDHARWHFGQAAFPMRELRGSVWGEGSPMEIGSVDGQQVLLLWPLILQSRSWDGGFFTPFLDRSLPDVQVIRDLTAGEFESWRTRLQLPSGADAQASSVSQGPKRPWWKRW